MDFIEAFAVLGIEKTEDKGIIKKAYRELLTQNNPEDHPEEFKRIRLAYETASKYVENPEDEQKEEEDTTPSGLVLAEFKKIYENISLRKDVKVFEEFFAKDIFMSLDEDELCREKILAYMMNHYYFPTAVWKLLDKHLRIQAGENELKEKFPTDYIQFIIVKCNNGEEVNFEQFEGAQDADYDEFIRYSEKIYQALREEKPEEAEQYLKSAEALKIYNPIMELAKASILRVKGNAGEAKDVLKRLYEKYPEDETARYNYAEALWNLEEKEAAAEIYKLLKEANDDHYMANVRLTEWFYESKEYDTAKKHAYCVLKFGCDDNFRDLLQRINDNLELQYKEAIAKNNHYKDKMELCWCYLQSERLLEALKLARSIENEVADEDRTEYIGMLAKIYIELGEFEESEKYARIWLSQLEKELPDEYERKINTAHYLISECLHFKAGYDNKLLEEAAKSLEELGNKLENEYGFLIKLAYIYADAGKVKECEQIAEFLEKRRIFVGHIALLECYNTMRDANGILEQSKVVTRYFPDMARPYELAVKVFYDHDLRNGMKDVLELVEQNGVTSSYLEAYKKLYERNEHPTGEDMQKRIDSVRANEIKAYRETRTENACKLALLILNQCFEDVPCGYLLVERALFYLEAQMYDEAEADLEKALEGDLYNQYAWNGLGGVHRARGDYDKAIACYNKSITVSGGEYILPYENIAECYEALCEYEDAKKMYELIITKFKCKREDYCYPLMKIYKNLGEWPEMIELAKRMYAPDSVEYYKKMLSEMIEMGDMKWAEDLQKAWKKKVAPAIPLMPIRDLAYCREASWYYLLASTRSERKDYAKAIGMMDMAFQIISGKSHSEVYYEVCEETLFMLYVGTPISALSKMGAKYIKEMGYLRQHIEVMPQQKKYRYYVLVLDAIFRGNLENAKKMLEEMISCKKCVYCNLAVCKEQMIAKGMLLELEGDEGYKQIYKDLYEKYPHDKYIMALYQYKVL